MPCSVQLKHPTDRRGELAQLLVDKVAEHVSAITERGYTIKTVDGSYTFRAPAHLAAAAPDHVSLRFQRLSNILADAAFERQFRSRPKSGVRPVAVALDDDLEEPHPGIEAGGPGCCALRGEWIDDDTATDRFQW